MDSAAVRFKAVVLLLLIYCLLLLPLLCGKFVFGPCYLVLIVVFAIISLGKREMVALL